MNKLILIIFAFFYISISFAQQAGTLDSSFNNTGLRIFDVMANISDLASAVIEQPDGKLLVSGSTNVGLDRKGFLVRFNVDGTFDSTFHSDGIVIIDMSNEDYDRFSDLAVRQDGKILVSGQTKRNGNDDLMLIQFLSDGSVDPNFGALGVMRLDVGQQSADWLTGMKLLQDGNCLIYGFDNGPQPRKSFVVKIDAQGQVVPGFGINGRFIWQENGSTIINDIVILPDGKIILGGYEKINNEFVATLMRITSNGIKDVNFGNSGKINYTFSQNKEEVINQLELAPDKTKLIAVGHTETNVNDDIIMARLSLDGSLDPTFGNGGYLQIDLSIGASDWPRKLLIQQDEKILISGRMDIGKLSFISRFLPNGQLDHTFNNTGYWIKDLSPSGLENIYDFIIDQQGKATVVGYITSLGLYSPFIGRFHLGLSPLSIDHTENSPQAFNVFPNPAEDNFFIYSELNGIFQMEVTDIKGKYLMHQKLDFFFNNKFNIDCSGWPKGIYLINIFNNENNFQTKFIKK